MTTTILIISVRDHMTIQGPSGLLGPILLPRTGPGIPNNSNEQGVTNPKQLLNNGRETILEESITSASGLSQGSKISSRSCTKIARNRARYDFLTLV